ncbi:DMT family transporter [Xylophilus sp.]|uniref:DMT family transporter n=1 Tax=Xylophilus sp. TaxID=2653893 RepID=UPI0013BAB876|nr:DMT family transporter [Xylophilus sp.]KAF1050299.1 MAG: hypothetical protein GAK38_00325 [Xylophilus sp.]
MSRSRSVSFAVLALLFNAFVWGVSWWPLRALQARGLHPLWATAGIYALALVVLFVLRPGVWRAFAQFGALWLLAIAAGLTNLGFNWAVTTGDVVRVVLLFYLMPLWSVLLAWPLLGEQPRPAGLARMALALAGVVVVLKAPGVDWPWPESGVDWLAIGAGLCFALTNILLRRLHAAPGPARAVAMFGGGTAAAALVALLGTAQGWVAVPPAPGWGWPAIGLVLAAAFLLGNMALQYGASRLPAQTTSLVMLSEVLFASASSIAAGAAQPAAQTYVGGALIVLAALWSALR